MTMGPALRKGVLVAHIGCSAGWLGAVLTSLALGVIGPASRDDTVVRAAYLALQPIGWYALIPLSLASLVTGLVQSLGTACGLLRHYWVVVKLLMNLAATAILLLYTQTLDDLAGMARTLPPGQLDTLRDPSPLAHGAAAVVLLTVALVLSVVKPRGLTRYGQHRQRRTLLPAT